MIRQFIHKGGRPVTALLLVVFLLGTACGRREATEATEVAVPVTAVHVRTLDLAPADFAVNAHLSGSTEARREAEISAKLAGTVERFAVEPGDLLAENDLILALDARPYRAALKQARAGLQAAEANLRQAERELERTRALKEKGRISEAEYEGVELRQLQAASARLGAQAACEQAELALEDTEIRAPFAGRLALKGVDAHEQIAPGQPVAAVVDLSGVLIRAGVGERDAVRIRPGMPVKITVPALDEARFRGIVKNVGVRSHPATRSFEVEIAVENVEGRLLSGMATRAVVVVETRPGAIGIPETAVVEQYGEPVAYVVEAGLARRRALTLGPRDGDRVQVLAGLNAGDQLIIKGQWSVSDGSPVEVEN